MITKEKLNIIIETIFIEEKEHFQDKDLFLTEAEIFSANRIDVQIDSTEGVKVKDCATLSKFIENKLDRDNEDFELTVSSAGLDRPFKVTKQYNKNIGKVIKVITTEGKRVRGKLINVSESEIELEKETKKKDIIKNTVKFSDIKEAKVVITF